MFNLTDRKSWLEMLGVNINKLSCWRFPIAYWLDPPTFYNLTNLLEVFWVFRVRIGQHNNWNICLISYKLLAPVPKLPILSDWHQLIISNPEFHEMGSNRKSLENSPCHLQRHLRSFPRLMDLSCRKFCPIPNCAIRYWWKPAIKRK